MIQRSIDPTHIGSKFPSHLPISRPEHQFPRAQGRNVLINVLLHGQQLSPRSRNGREFLEPLISSIEIEGKYILLDFGRLMGEKTVWASSGSEYNISIPTS
jgi:hypothetical protein